MTDIDTSPEAVTAPDRVWLDPEGYRDGWTGLPEQIVEGDVEYIRADIYGVLSARLTDAEAERDRLRSALAPAAMLEVYDRFMAGGGITPAERKQVDQIATAAAFGSAAFMGAVDADQGTAAMLRAFLTALVDPMHPDLDYLRADPKAAISARAALAGD